MRDILRLHKAVFDDLRRAGNGGERRFQLVRHIGGEFAAHAFAGVLFRDVENDEHRAGDVLLVADRVGYDLEIAAFSLKKLLVMLAGKRKLHGFAEALAAVERKHALPFAHGFRAKQPERARVVGKKIRAAVDHEEALAHVFGDRREFRLLALELLNLAVDHAVLVIDLGKQGRKLFIDLALLRVFQIDGVDRAQDALCKRGGQHAGKDRRKHEDDDHGREQAHDEHPDGVLCGGNAQHRAILKAGGEIDAPFIKRGGIARALAGAVCKRFPDLFAVGMVFHGGSFGIAVVKHGAVRSHPGDAVCAVKPVEIRGAALRKPLGDVGGFALQLRLDLLAQVLIKHAEDQDEAGEQHCRGNEKDRAKDTRCHASSPPILYPMPRTVWISAPQGPSFCRSVRTCTSTVRLSPSNA